jgi:glycosyltransferase involved in cell wall biosynthesis
MSRVDEEAARGILHLLTRFHDPAAAPWLYRVLRHVRHIPMNLLSFEAEETLAHYAEADRPTPREWPFNENFTFPPRGARQIKDRLVGGLQRLFLGRKQSLHEVHLADLLYRRPHALVHTHLTSHFVETALRSGAKVLVSYYGGDLQAVKGEKNLRRLERVLSLPVQFLVTSEHLRRHLTDHGVPPARAHVIKVGVNIDDFPSLEEVGDMRASDTSGSRPLRIVTVGRFTECKAQDELPRVARALKDRGVPFEWTLIGDGPLRAEIEAGIADARVEDDMKLAGHLPFGEVRARLKRADLMVHNARVAESGDHEALGISLVEANAMGLPVVSCRLGGIPEAVEDGVSALLVDPGDLDGMAECVRELAENPDRRHRMGLAGARHARDAFDSRKLAEEYDELYSRLLSS